MTVARVGLHQGPLSSIQAAWLEEDCVWDGELSAVMQTRAVLQCTGRHDAQAQGFSKLQAVLHDPDGVARRLQVTGFQGDAETQQATLQRLLEIEELPQSQGVSTRPISRKRF